MPSRILARLTLALALAAAGLLASAQAHAQSGLRLPERDAPGLDPSFARGWLAPDFDRFGFARHHWSEGMGVAAGERMNWSYDFGERGSLGMSMRDTRQFGYEPRSLSLFGHYALGEDWALSAETTSHDAPGLFRLQDLRIGVQRRF